MIAIAAGLLLLGPALQAAASGPQAWEQTDKLVPQESGQFGDAVAIDGDTLLVGAPREGDVGAAYVYEQGSDGDWEQTHLTPDPAASDAEAFGISVALEGDVAVVGDHEERSMSSASQGGALYIFANTADGWTQQYTITPPAEQEGSDFGEAIAYDGTTLVVGAQNQDTTDGNDAGAAYVYAVDASSATLTQTLTAADAEAGDRFGADVAVDGASVLVGASGADRDGETNAGAAYAFEAGQGGTFAQADQVEAQTPSSYTGFGSAVDLDGDTATVLTSAGVGGAEVFAWTSRDLTHTQTLLDNSLGPLGTATTVDSSIDGDRLVVSGSTEFAPKETFVFENDGGEWVETAKVTRNPNLFDGFGDAVALDGDTLAVGAPAHDDPNSGRDGGATFLYSPCSPDGTASVLDDALAANVPTEAGAQDTAREANCQYVEQAP